MKKMQAAALFLLCLLLAFPALCVEGAKSGLLLWFNTIIPTLFPFILVTNIIRDLNGIPLFERIFSPVLSRIFKTTRGGSYPVIIGFLCGYPMGAKAVTDSYSCGRISKEEANYLLCFTNNPSPIYMLSYVALYTLDDGHLRLPVIVIALLTAWLVSCVYRMLHYFTKEHMPAPKWTPTYRKAEAGQGLFDSSIMSACELLVKVGGYMILFSILSRCLMALPFMPPMATCVISGLLEQTTGLGLLKTQPFLPAIKTVLAMVFICFGGLSITAQTYSVIHTQGLSIKNYIISKILSAVIALGLTAAYIRWIL